MPAPRQHASAGDRDTQRDIADAEHQAGHDQLPQPERRPRTEIGGEEVLPPLQEQHGSAGERRQEPGHAQSPGLLELAGEDPDQYQQDDRERGEVQQVDGHPRGAPDANFAARMHER